MSEAKREAWARRRVRALRGFYRNLSSYILVNVGLVGLNFYLHGSLTWSLLVLAVWGFGLAAHALRAFGGGTFLGPDWEERKVKELLSRKH